MLAGVLVDAHYLLALLLALLLGMASHFIR
jgi:hypothetical protein